MEQRTAPRVVPARPRRERPRRYLAKLAVAVLSRGSAVIMATVNLSPGGCALRWTGTPPPVHVPVRLRFGLGPRSPEVDCEVRWVRAGAEPTVGIRFVDPRAAAALGGLLAEVVRRKPPTV